MGASHWPPAFPRFLLQRSPAPAFFFFSFFSLAWDRIASRTPRHWQLCALIGNRRGCGLGRWARVSGRAPALARSIAGGGDLGAAAMGGRLVALHAADGRRRRALAGRGGCFSTTKCANKAEGPDPPADRASPRDKPDTCHCHWGRTWAYGGSRGGHDMAYGAMSPVEGRPPPSRSAPTSPLPQ